MTELRQLFFESAGELVQKLNDEALRLEKSPGDAETARSLRRTVHTLKGDSAACGFRELSELAHEFEDVLTLGNTAAAALVPEIALRAADVFAALLEAYRNGTKLPSIQSLRADIARLAHPAAGAGNTSVNINSDSKSKSKVATKKKKAAAKTTRWSEYEQLAITHALELGKRVHHVVVEVDPQCGMPIAGRQMIQLALAGLGEILALYPVEGSLDPITRVEAALVSEKPVEQIRAKCSIPTIALNVAVTPLRDTRGRSKTAGAGASPLPPDLAADFAGAHDTPAEAARATASVAAPVAEIEASAIAEPSAAPAVATGPDNVLRVDADRIDSVLNLVGELILAKSMLQQSLLEFGQRFPKDALQGKFADAMAFQGRVLNDLQHSVMKIRMVPVEQLFRRFPRVVRDVGRQCGKEVELSVRGGQTDLDKSILDAIAEPMTHLVRNAIGHGIETAAERVRGRQAAARKPSAGGLSSGESGSHRGLRRRRRDRCGESPAARPIPGIAASGTSRALERDGYAGTDPAAGILHGGRGYRTVGPGRGIRCSAERADTAEGNDPDRNGAGTGHNLPSAASADAGHHPGVDVPGGAAALCVAAERGGGDCAHDGREYPSGGALRRTATAQRRVASAASGLRRPAGGRKRRERKVLCWSSTAGTASSGCWWTNWRAKTSW